MSRRPKKWQARCCRVPTWRKADVVGLLPLLARHKDTSLAVKLLEGLRLEKPGYG